MSSALNLLLWKGSIQSAVGSFDLELEKKGTVLTGTLETAHIVEGPRACGVSKGNTEEYRARDCFWRTLGAERLGGRRMLRQMDGARPRRGLCRGLALKSRRWPVASGSRERSRRIPEKPRAQEP